MSTKTTRRAPARTKAAKPKPVADEIEDLEEDAPEEVVEETPKKTRRTPAKRVRKAAPEPVDEDDEDASEDDDEELEEEAPKKTSAKKAPPKREEPKYGTKWLAEVVSEKIGREVASYDLRGILRKLARDGKIERTIGETRDRYVFKGAKDPVVKLVVDMIKSGAAAKDKKEKLAGLKSKSAKAKAAKAQEVEEDFEDEDVEDLEDDE
jgi:hypothetical protein